jgi:hypothetical protein
MKKLPTDDPAFGKGTIRADGRKMHSMYLYEVKKPSESKGAWDYYKLKKEVPAEQAFRPLNAGECSLVSTAATGGGSSSTSTTASAAGSTDAGTASSTADAGAAASMSSDGGASAGDAGTQSPRRRSRGGASGGASDGGTDGG